MWALLKPANYNVNPAKSPALVAMNLLGKLGARACCAHRAC